MRVTKFMRKQFGSKFSEQGELWFADQFFYYFLFFFFLWNLEEGGRK